MAAAKTSTDQPSRPTTVAQWQQHQADLRGKIAAAGGSVSPAQLAGGIKMALITTIFGLTVAIPVGVAFYTLRNRVIKTSTEINAVAEDLFERFRKQ